MTQQQLEKLVKELAKIRNSDEIIVYITGDKNPPELFATAMAPDVIPIFDKHLFKLGKKKKISLFLYSTGGALEAPWPLVSLIREYCSEFEVIIPSKALSAATLLCLGADKILMTPSSFLSPTDPQGSFLDGQERKNIQVEDVVGFIDFVKNKIGVTEQNALAEVTKVLSSQIPPSILGSINRTHSLIRSLAEKMLRLHKLKLEEHQIKVIVENLTEKLFSHQHLIGRNEAKNKIGFKKLIDYTDAQEEKTIRNIFEYYVNQMQLNTTFDPERIIKDKTEESIDIKRAIIQSSAGEDAYTTTYKIQKIQEPSAPKPFTVSLMDKGWNEISTPLLVQPSSVTIKVKGVKKNVKQKNS